MAGNVVYRRIDGQEDKLVFALAAQNHCSAKAQPIAALARHDFDAVLSGCNYPLGGRKADALKVLHLFAPNEKARGIAPRGPEACSTQRLNSERTLCL